MSRHASHLAVTRKSETQGRSDLNVTEAEKKKPAQGRIERALVSDNQLAGLVGSNE